MAKGTDIVIGPWPDGINQLDQKDQIRDSQLVDCRNFDIDNTGVLIPRRPYKYLAIDANTTNLKYLLGTVILDGETQPRAVVNNYDSGALTSTFRFVGDPTAAPLNASFTRSNPFKSVVQYQSKIWYIPSTATGIGASSPSSAVNTFTSVAAMPYGDYGFILKDRLFIVRKNSSELYFSKATDFTVWAAPDGGVIQINPGDNSPITKVVVVNNQIIIFKRDSTYVLSFTTSPTGDGTVRQVSADQGALDAITYNNEVYCYNARSVFKFVNGYFQDIGLQLNLEYTETIDANSYTARINVVGKQLMLGSFSNITYVMNLDTGAWSKYEMSSNAAFASMRTGTVYSRSSKGTAVIFGDGTTKLYYFLATRPFYSQLDVDVNNDLYVPSFSMETKHFDFDDAETWKRLYSWHLDLTGTPYSDAYVSTYINRSGGPNLTTRDTKDLIGTSASGEMRSFRFKTVAFGFDSFVYYVTDPNIFPGPTIRSIRAVIGAKAPVSS